MADKEASPQPLADEPDKEVVLTPKKQAGLARYFATGSPKEQSALQAPAATTPQPRQAGWGSGGLAAAEKPQEPAASLVLAPLEASTSQAVVKAAQPRKCLGYNRGGRPKKAADQSAKSTYRSITGRQRLFMIEMMDTKLGEGSGKNKAMKQTARYTGVSFSSVKKTYKEKEYWKEWCADRDMVASTVPQISFRSRGDSRSKLASGEISKGCKRPGSRGYLGRTDHCRFLVQTVKHWAEIEETTGHELGKADLLKQFERELDSAVAYGKDDREAGLLTPEQKKQLEYLEKKQNQLVSDDASRRWQSS